MLDRDAITKIQELSQSEITEIGESTFHVSSKGATAVIYPTRDTDIVFSLSQVVSLVKSMIKNYSDQNLLVNVAGPEVVEVWDSKWDANEEREVLIKSDFSKVYDKFPFGTQLSQEDFIIKLQTLFEQSDSRSQLMKVVSAVRAERLQTSDDDGVSQVAATRAGVVLTNKETIDNLWVLSTFQTFPEVDQPKIPYILRLHQREDELPKFALYPCDGGKWKVDTTLTIRKFLESQLKPEITESRVVVL